MSMSRRKPESRAAYSSNKSQFIDPSDCSGCGSKCCKSLTIPFDKSMDSAQLSLAKRICMLEGLLATKYETKSHINVVLHYKCKHLKPNGDCDIYNKGRPLMCETFPDKDDLFCPEHKLRGKSRR